MITLRFPVRVTTRFCCCCTEPARAGGIATGWRRATSWFRRPRLL